MPPSLRKAVAAAIGGGAVAIASVLITGPSGDDGLEGVSYIPYEDIVGVWTVCHGHTGKDIMPGKTYTGGLFCGVNMAVKISGVLKDGTGKPVENCTIQLKARRTSSTVVVNTVASENPDEVGRYSMDVEYGQYSVILLVEGFPGTFWCRIVQSFGV